MQNRIFEPIKVLADGQLAEEDKENSAHSKVLEDNLATP